MALEPSPSGRIRQFSPVESYLTRDSDRLAARCSRSVDSLYSGAASVASMAGHAASSSEPGTSRYVLCPVRAPASSRSRRRFGEQLRKAAAARRASPP